MLEKLTKEELTALRNKLRDDAFEKIANTTGKSIASVIQILYKPERFNNDVLTAALDLAEREPKEQVDPNKEILNVKNRINALA